MLDQNTDRMWYVIGALVVGAGIILLANKTMPEIFASVGGMFEDFIGSVNVEVDGNTEGIYVDEEIEVLIEEGYIPIATADELSNVRSATLETYGKGTEWEDEYTGGFDKKYVQVANIDLSSFKNWTPIGTNSSIFTGIYDGNGHNITGLTISRPETDYVGLFGYTRGAIIRNVGLIDNTVIGNYQVGGLVGSAGVNTKITNSYATGEVTGTGHHAERDTGTVNNDVGGLVGHASYSTIENSYATGSVKGSGYSAGGLVGDTYTSTIRTSYSTVEVTGDFEVGGLVGWAGGSTKIINSYATGSVKGTRHDVGGLVGRAYNSSTIENSYATGSVTGLGNNVGGLAGLASHSTVTNSYWNKETTEIDTSAGGEGATGKTTDEMKKKDTYLGWDFDTVWKIDEGDYPKLR